MVNIAADFKMANNDCQAAHGSGAYKLTGTQGSDHNGLRFNSEITRG
jgi:hypothetical protein